MVVNVTIKGNWYGSFVMFTMLLRYKNIGSAPKTYRILIMAMENYPALSDFKPPLRISKRTLTYWSSIR